MKLQVVEATRTALPSRYGWRDAFAYQEAVQNPGVALGDAQLKGCQVIVDRRGLPVAYSGRFAVVFRLREPATGREYALRCFTHAGESQNDLRARYEVMAQWAERHRPAYLAPFRFVEYGVRVEKAWRPALVMRWAGGDTLGRWVERRVLAGDAAALLRLADALADLRAAMKKDGVSHGDWQHDNLLVSDNGRSVTLVDYDGLFVPELAGWPPPAERGHPNYQHPYRDENDFGPGRDRFAHLVLDAGLRALARDPGLWHTLGAAATGECVLFTRQDFLDPDASPVFAAVRDLAHRTGDATLGESVARLAAACHDAPAPAITPTPTAAVAAVRVGGTVEKWWLSPELSPESDALGATAANEGDKLTTTNQSAASGQQASVGAGRHNEFGVALASFGVSCAILLFAMVSFNGLGGPHSGQMSPGFAEPVVIQTVPPHQTFVPPTQDTQEWMAHQAARARVAGPSPIVSADPFQSSSPARTLDTSSPSVPISPPHKLVSRASYRDVVLGNGAAVQIGRTITALESEPRTSYPVQKIQSNLPPTPQTYIFKGRAAERDFVFRSTIGMRPGGKRTITLVDRDGYSTTVYDVEVLTVY